MDSKIFVDLLEHQVRIIDIIKKNPDKKKIWINDPPGTGKTLLGLSLIDLIKKNDAKLIRTSKGNKYAVLYNKVYITHSVFEDKKTETSVIIVNRNIIKQWESAIKEFTTFSYIIVDNAKKLFSDIKLENYDIVLLKNAHCTCKKERFYIPGYFKSKYQYLFKVVIVDDDYHYNEFLENDHGDIVHPNGNIICVLNADLGLSQAEVSRKNILLVKSSKEELENSLNIPKYECLLYKLKRQDDDVILLLSEIADEEIISSINADISNISVNRKTYTNTFDIFAQLLKENFNKYKSLQENKEKLMEMQDKIEELEPEDEYDEDLIENIKNKKYSRAMKQLVNNPDVVSHISECLKEIEIELKDIVKPLDRMRENIKNNECPITCMPLKDAENIAILGCCSIIIDASCALMLFNNNLCPNCRGKVSKDNFLLLNMENINYEDLLSDEKKEIKCEESNEVYYTKIDKIAEILSGKIEDHTKVRLKLGILNGLADKGFEDKERKILIFTDYDQGISTIKDICVEQKIKYEVLMGTSSEMDKIITRYWLPYNDENATNLLLINSTKYIAGMNLQNTTDIILYHTYTEDVMTQIIGRGVRIGQKKNIRVHLLSYSNELAKIKKLFH